jgi:phosphoglycerate dehydrogenase-like enzyme
MPTFHVALTGDFLDTTGRIAIGDAGTGLLASCPTIRHHFLADHAPRPGDADYWKRFYSLEVTPEQLAGVNGLIILRPHVKRAALADATDLVVIGRSGAGYDKIDVAACTEHGIALFNVPDALNHPTASAALLLMLALGKRLFQQERVARTGQWEQQAQVLGAEIQGRTLGIVGLGHSGRELCRLVAPFEMRLTTLDVLLSESDFVSLHSRLTDDNRGLISRDRLARMRPSAYLINVARGELIDQLALTEALQQRRIAGAGLDVFEHEPLPPDDPLTKLDNVILTPHWLASTSDVWQATGRATAEGMLRAAAGQVPDNVVNPEVLNNPAFRDKLARFAAT